MLAEQRRNEVLQAIRRRKGVQTAELAVEFGVSEMTIRRDLYHLAENGLIRRVRGGALEPGRYRSEPPFEQSRMDRAEEKARVGQAAAQLVQPGDTIILDIGTTTLELAKCLHGREGLTVATNNLAVYQELVTDEAIDILLLGGLVRRNYRSLVGYLTEDSLSGIRGDLTFIGISGVSDDLHLLDTTLEEIPAKRAMMRAGRRVVLLADGAKFTGSGLGRVAGIDAVDAVVTTGDVRPAVIDALRERGVEVIVA